MYRSSGYFLLDPLIDNDMAQVTDDNDTQTGKKNSVCHTACQCRNCQDDYTDNEYDYSQIFYKLVHGYRYL